MNEVIRIIFGACIAGTGTWLSACVPIEQSADLKASLRYDQLVDQGIRLLNSEDVDSAEAAFKLATEIAQGAEAIDGLGCVEFQRGNLVEAKDRFLEAIRFDPNYTSAVGNLALIYDLEEESELAKQHYLSAIAAAPTNPVFRNNFAAFLTKGSESNPAEAYKQLRTAQVVVDHQIIEDNLREVKNRL